MYAQWRHGALARVWKLSRAIVCHPNSTIRHSCNPNRLWYHLHACIIYMMGMQRCADCQVNIMQESRGIDETSAHLHCIMNVSSREVGKRHTGGREGSRMQKSVWHNGVLIIPLLPSPPRLICSSWLSSSLCADVSKSPQKPSSTQSLSSWIDGGMHGRGRSE